MAALLHGAPAVTAQAARPVVSAFTLRPTILRPGVKATFRFLTTRSGSGSIALARITTTGRYLRVGRLRFAVDAGEGKRSFDGRIDGRRLAAGRYRATVTVRNAITGTSVPRRLTFRMTAR